MSRIFVYDGREFPDPDPQASVEEVRQHMSTFFPELTNAETREETRGDDHVYTFTRRIGTKGRRRSPAIVAILRRVPPTRLRVFELAAELVGPDGDLDLDAAVAREPEVNLAIAEAGAYAAATRRAREALQRLAPQ